MDFSIVPTDKLAFREDLPKMPALARPADAKEIAIVCLSAALLFTSLAVLALASER
jgi:hypothetical protein